MEISENKTNFGSWIRNLITGNSIPLMIPIKPFATSIITCILLLSLFQCSYPEVEEENDVKRDKLSGSVKYMKEINFDAIYQSGKIIKQTENNWNETKYDEWGYYTEINSFIPEEDVVETTRFENKYNKQGNLIEKLTFYQGQTITYKTLYSYNKYGKLIEISMYDAKDNLNTKILYSYDRRGNMVERKSLNSSGVTSNIYRCKYDSYGNKKQAISYKADNEIMDISIFEYDENGNEIEWSNVDPEDQRIIASWKYVYDEKGNQTAATLIGSLGNIKGRWVSIYDDHGMEIDVTHWDEDRVENRWKYEYTYDGKGNWIKLISYPVNTPYENGASVRERTITYYE